MCLLPGPERDVLRFIKREGLRREFVVYAIAVLDSDMI
jgi:hypothetical protein